MAATPIAIVDYGLGNLRSVLNALRHVGAEAELVTAPEALAGRPGVIIPGVGAFEQAIAALRDTGMVEALDAARQAGTAPKTSPMPVVTPKDKLIPSTL